MHELLLEALHEITANPLTYAIEVVQFGFLVFLIYAVGIRFRGKPGMLTNMLTKRRERIVEALQDASSADEELDAARRISTQQLADARSEARRLVAEARRTAEEEARNVLAAIEDEVAQVRREAEQTIAKERTEMLSGVQEQLVDLVTQATRQMLDEGYTPAEQRALIQKSVMESLDDLESVTLS